MFTVLLATNRPEVRQAFADFPSWEAMGYQSPRLADSLDEAMASIQSAPPDAIAIDLPRPESAALYDLLQGYPHTLYMKAAADEHSLAMSLEELTGMLERAGSLEGTTQALLPELREEFFQTLLDGYIRSEKVLTHRLQALELSDLTDAPCIITQLSLPQVERYLQEVWRYGRARLGVAMRKFFHPASQVALSSLTAGSITLLYLPKAGTEEDMQAEAGRVVAQAIDDMANYMGLEVSVESTRTLHGLQGLLTPKEEPHGVH